MIIVNPDKRITAQEALEHPWIKTANTDINNADCVALSPEVVESLKNYRGRSVLKRQALEGIVQHLNPVQIKKLKVQF